MPASQHAHAEWLGLYGDQYHERAIPNRERRDLTPSEKVVAALLQLFQQLLKVVPDFLVARPEECLEREFGQLPGEEKRRLCCSGVNHRDGGGVELAEAASLASSAPAVARRAGW
ncbi:hypothetical protein [Streptomyces atratus]